MSKKPYTILFGSRALIQERIERMMNMSQQDTIRQLYAKGMGISDIARSLKCDKKTVRRYVTQDDYSPKPPITVNRPSMLDPYKEMIASWIDEDSTGFTKQRHTYQRIKERLEDECGFSCKLSTLADFIRKNDLRKKTDNRSNLSLSWEPGCAQVDFGQADCMFGGNVVRMHYLVLSFPYSNMGFAQAFFGETAECIAQGLADIFTYIGGVPRTIVFDNATGIGRRVHGCLVECELFCRLKTHYRFVARYCNPAAGWEKGNVERKVALIRNELFVPVPIIDDIEAYNKNLLVRCRFQEDKMHYAKKQLIGELFDKDCSALLSLPDKQFAAVRYEVVRADGWGHVTVDETHTYSSAPECSHAELIVAVGAHTVAVMMKSGEVIAKHCRAFGKGKTQTIDALSQLRLLCRRPGGFKNSKIREQMPESVITYLDARDASELRHDLKLLYDACERSGLVPVLDALDVLSCERDNFPDFFQVGVLAARIAEMGLEGQIVSGADLGIYDEMFLGGGKDE
jgi:transposase